MTLAPETNGDDHATVADRRRPGRRADVNPELIPLLRTGDMKPGLDEELALYEDDDNLAGMRGIAAGLLCSVPLWVGIGYVARWVLR